MWRVVVVSLLFGSACSLVTERVAPFAPLDVRVAREAPPPPPPPVRVHVAARRIDITDKVQFQTGSAEILQVSYALLDEVAHVMEQNPQIKLVSVEGHTDSVGGAALNRTLSQQRADSVVKYLVERGIDAARLTAKGYGPDKPVADNGTEEGREQNRRVEFTIVSQQGDK